jgi:DNA-binding NarL/FixJ family response regulator
MNTRVLLVEDDRVVQYYLAQTLKDGFDLIPAISIKEAIQSLEQHPVALILLDLVVADGTGVELLEYLRDKNLKIPVIVLSGITDPAIIEEVRAFGISAYVRKDQDLEALTSEIKRALATA